MSSPDHLTHTEGFDIYQSLFDEQKGKPFLIRVFVNIKKSPNLIITVYKTSKISKYYESKI